MVVRDPHCGPYRTNLQRAGAKYFKVPDFFWIGNGDAFPGITVSVFFDKFSDEPDSITGIVTSL